MHTVILASTSPRRKELMRSLGVPFRAEASRFRESIIPGLSPRALAERMAIGKAGAVAKRHKDAVVISADTVVAMRGKIYGKPKDAAHARRMLREFSGKTPEVITAFAIIDGRGGKTVLRSFKHKVFFRRISTAEINAYVATGEPLDKAGGWAIQGRGALFIRKMEGNYAAVLGLPVFDIALELEKMGVKLWRNA